MLWIISAAAVAGIAAAGVFAALWLVERRSANRLCKELNNDARLLSDSYEDCEHWKHEACLHLERERAAVEQAKVFERVSKTMEEHAAAERGRADRLAAALRESEDKCEQLEQELKKMRCVESAHPMGTVLDEMKKRGEAPVFSAAMQNNLAQEFANIAAYNGTDEGQVELKHG